MSYRITGGELSRYPAQGCGSVMFIIQWRVDGCENSRRILHGGSTVFRDKRVDITCEECPIGTEDPVFVKFPWICLAGGHDEWQ